MNALLEKVAQVNRTIGSTMPDRDDVSVIRARVASNGHLEVLAFWQSPNCDASWRNVGTATRFRLPSGQIL